MSLRVAQIGKQAASGPPLRRRRRTGEDEIDITPMIDIVFLLLIFFIVTSKMDDAAKENLAKSDQGDPRPSANSVVITVVGDGQGGALLFKGMGRNNAISGDDEAQAEAIRDYVISELGEGKEHVWVMAEWDVKHREVARVLKAINSAKEAAPQFEVVNLAIEDAESE